MNSSIKCSLFALLVVGNLSLSAPAIADSKTVFKGLPHFGINEFGFRREAGQIDPTRIESSAVVISEVDGKYYWASRENRELRKIVGGEPHGAITTYFALDGSGYIRIIVDPKWKRTMRMRFPDYNLDYTEHMLQGLGSFTYFGAEARGAQ